jgi:hypothetical protein
MPRWTRIAVSFGALALAATIVALLLWVPEWMVNQHVRGGPRIGALEYARVVDDYRRTLAQVLGGMVVIVGLWLTWRTVRTAEEGRTTDRFTKSIEQLGATGSDGEPQLELRLGGIYGLEALARDSARYHCPVMEVLTAYVRHHSPRGALRDGDTPHPDMQTSLVPKVRKDIQAILTVIGRRRAEHERGRGFLLDLRLIDISTATVSDGNFDRSILVAARIECADFRRARLNDAKLFAAELRSISLKDATLRNSVLSEAHLEGADLSGADLTGASLDGAHLEGATLTGAVVTQEQIQQAFGDEFTQLPNGITMPTHWSGRNDL